MAGMIPDTLDFAQWEQATEAASKVRRASDWMPDVLKRLTGVAVATHPTMTSTKMRNFIEFRPGEVTAWAGYNGHRKSMFTSQVALDLCRQSERVLMASLEMLPEQTLGRMLKQASATERTDPAWASAFGKWSDGRLWLFDHLGRIKPALCLGVCRYFAEELQGSHAFIDSMMMVCASEEHLDEQKQFMTDLVRLAQETGLHVHLVAHCRKPGAGGGEDRPPTKYDLRGSAALSDQAANVITVWANKPKRAALEQGGCDEEQASKPDALVTIEKQRNGAWEGRMQLWFDETCLRFVDERMAVLHSRPIDLK